MAAGRATLPQMATQGDQASTGGAAPPLANDAERRRARDAERKRLHRVREALGIMVADVEVGPELQDDLEAAGYLGAGQAHNRKALGRALLRAARDGVALHRLDRLRHA